MKKCILTLEIGYSNPNANLDALRADFDKMVEDGVFGEWKDCDDFGSVQVGSFNVVRGDCPHVDRELLDGVRDLLETATEVDFEDLPATEESIQAKRRFKDLQDLYYKRTGVWAGPLLIDEGN